MKGLLLKDFLNLRQQGKLYFLIIGIWMAIGLINHDSAFFGGVMSMLTVLVPVSAMAYDDKAHWERYALTMPVSRTDMVLSKYALAGVCALFGTILSDIAGILITRDAAISFHMALTFMSLGVFFASVVLPVMFKFGVEKGRLMLFLIILVPTVLLATLSKLGVSFTDATIKAAVLYAPAGAAAAGAVSFLISKRVYTRKEF